MDTRNAFLRVRIDVHLMVPGQSPVVITAGVAHFSYRNSLVKFQFHLNFA